MFVNRFRFNIAPISCFSFVSHLDIIATLIAEFLAWPIVIFPFLPQLLRPWALFFPLSFWIWLLLRFRFDLTTIFTASLKLSSGDDRVKRLFPGLCLDPFEKDFENLVYGQNFASR